MNTLRGGAKRTRNVLGAITVLLMLATTLALAPNAVAQASVDVPEGQYILRNVGFDRYLETDGDTARTGAEIGEYSTWNVVANGSNFRLVNEGTSRYLDADNAAQSFDVDLAGPNTRRGLDWRFEEVDGGYYLRNTSFNRLLDADGQGRDFNVDTGPNGQEDNIWELIPVADAAGEGAVYVQTNLDAGNGIAAFARSEDGSLTHIGDFETGGLGSTEFDGGEGLDPLISADSIIVTDDEEYLLTVNAGSDSISVFGIQDDFSLELLSVTDSGGVGPNSLAYDSGRVFVTNIDRDGLAFGGPDPRAEPNDEGNVVGFTLEADGSLVATGQVADLDNRPANIDFSLNGTRLVVSAITAGSAVLPGANAAASIYVFNIDGNSLTLADTGSSRAGVQSSTINVTVENLQTAVDAATGETVAVNSADGTFDGEFDPETGLYSVESGFFFTEPWVGFSNGQFDLFDVGSPANAGLEQIAEGGSFDILTDAFSNAVGSDSPRASFQGPLLNGPFDESRQAPGRPDTTQWIAPGDDATASFEILNAANYRYFSFASMIIPSNDAFFANDDPWAYEVFDAEGNFIGGDEPIVIEVTAADLYDSGTEANDGRGAAGFSLGVGGTLGASNSGDSTNTGGQGISVAAHGGLDNFLNFNNVADTTVTDLLDSDEPIARFYIDVEQVGRNQPNAIDFDIASINGNEYVVVTEAREFNAEGAPPTLPDLQAGSVSVYQLNPDSTLTLTEDDNTFGSDPFAPNQFGANGQQLTACWIDFGANGTTFYVSNAIGATISSLELNPDGSVSVIDTVAAAGTSGFDVPGQPISGPETFGRTDGFIDLDVSPDGEYLYQLAGLSGSIFVYEIGHDGGLTFVEEVTGALPEIDTQGLISVGSR